MERTPLHWTATLWQAAGSRKKEEIGRGVGWDREDESDDAAQYLLYLLLRHMQHAATRIMPGWQRFPEAEARWGRARWEQEQEEVHAGAQYTALAIKSVAY